jgi:hypothetical protein
MGLSQPLLVIIIIVLSIIVCFLINKLIELGFELWRYKKFGPPPSTGMYYDAKLGSINGEVDNRGKYICDECEQRFKTKRELNVHLRKKKLNKIKNGI